jgi:serine/threonine-protein kinase HipA
LPIGETPQGIDLSTSLENEWLCARVLDAFGILVARCEIAQFGSTRALIVARFDRRTAEAGNWLVRLPQEDLCQATGTPAAQKYERDGGPGIRAVMDLLLGARDAQADRLDFFRTQVVFWMLCAIDGHAKNFSVFIEPQGRYRLTPRYDVLSAYPALGHGARLLSAQKARMAMAALGRNRHYRWQEIRRTHWEQTAAQCGIAAAGKAVIDELAERAPAAIARVAAVLPKGFPDRVAQPVLEGLAAAAQQLAA